MSLNTKFIYDDLYVEKRKSIRADFLAKVDYKINNERQESSNKKMLLINISRDGGLLSGDENVVAGDRIDITFNAPFADFKKITLSGIVIRSNNNRNNTQNIGIMFNKNIYANRINDFVRDINKGYYCGCD